MTAVCSLALVLMLPAMLPAEESKASPVGKKIADFTLRDYRGAERSLKEFTQHKLVVVAFLGCECPVAKLYGARLAELAKEYEAKSVAFVGINSNQQDGVSAIAHYTRAHKIEFPVLKDVGNVVADLFGAEKTPEVFVLDSQGVIRYAGRVDDQYGIGYTRPKPEHRDLVAALDELLDGKPVTTARTETQGCFIGRVRQPAKDGKVTYSKQIARILQNRCVECHHPGAIGPFSLTRYEDAAGWA